MTETFVKQRKHNLTGKVEKVGIDDACAFLARFKNGSLATFESTRYARGHKALYTFEINGEHASIFWDLHDLHRLQYFDHRDEGRVRGWRTSMSPMAIIPTWTSGGCPACRSATNTVSCIKSPISWRRRQWQTRQPHLPRRPGNSICLRCGSQIRQVRKVGKGAARKVVGGNRGGERSGGRVGQLTHHRIRIR